MDLIFPLHLFEGFGIELEYMIVDKKTLKVMPVADKLLESVAGTYVNEMDRGTLSWSNELVLHVIELKTNGPTQQLFDLPNLFQSSIREINQILETYGACLLPTAAHPFMNPFSETCIWPHEQTAIYHSYNRIFDCSGHGWSNLQSTHINLPFASDEEFARLHTAIRLLLPLIPALTSSSPIIEGQITGYMDTRLEYYRTNQVKVPTITGKVVPETVASIQEYQDKILKPMYRDIAPYDIEGILQEEWLNSRGAIARFERGAIEIRILDIQECPLADLSIVELIISVLKALVDERWSSYEDQIAWSENYLSTILLNTIKNGSTSVLTDTGYLSQFGVDDRNYVSAGELWRFMVDDLLPYQKDENELFRAPLEIILDHGSLSERIVKAIGGSPEQTDILRVYQKLADHLQEGTLFLP
ncbi:MAG TPA: glutamate-cysteine ligase family protein [Balneolales bacterium]|nr:glutamate-cysteine ligase family protein [Balneolales bacterium]